MWRVLLTFFILAPAPLFAALEESFNPERGSGSAFLENTYALRETPRPALSESVVVAGLAQGEEIIGVIPGPPSLSYIKKNITEAHAIIASLTAKSPPSAAFLGSVVYAQSKPVIITGRFVATERSYAEGLIIEKITQLPVIIPSESGERLMGACDDEEVVIALYKKIEEYAADPLATIVTRVRLCVNGSYSYALRDLPVSLPDGRYYLLVSERFGAGFPQTPLSALAEITLERKSY